MDISTNNALTAVSYGAVGCVGAMAAANVVLVGAGVSAKAGAFVADYFKNDSVAQNLRIKGDQLFSLAGKYAATELKVAAALVAVGGSSALAQYAINENNDICKIDRLSEIQGMCFSEAEETTKEAVPFFTNFVQNIGPNLAGSTVLMTDEMTQVQSHGALTYADIVNEQTTRSAIISTAVSTILGVVAITLNVVDNAFNNIKF